MGCWMGAYVIISLRGANGAGKSYIVRQILAKYDHCTEMRVDWKRKPLGYWLADEKMKDLFVPGHYESGVNGGIDTLSSIDFAYDLIQAQHIAGHNIIYEGQNFTDRCSRLMGFSSEIVRVVVIKIPVEECIASVRARGHKIKEETIRKTHDFALKDASIFNDQGYKTHICDRASALRICMSLLQKAS